MGHNRPVLRPRCIGPARAQTRVLFEEDTAFSYTNEILKFYNRMTVHCNRFLVNKTNRCNEIQFCFYYDSTCFGQPFCPSSGVLSRTSALVRFMQFWWPYATSGRMEFHPTPGSIWSSKLHKSTKADVRLRTPDDGQKGCPKQVES